MTVSSTMGFTHEDTHKCVLAVLPPLPTPSRVAVHTPLWWSVTFPGSRWQLSPAAPYAALGTAISCDVIRSEEQNIFCRDDLGPWGKRLLSISWWAK